MAEALIFGLAAYVAYVVRKAILELKKVDKNIDKLIAIEKAQKLIDDELKRINGK